MQLCVPPLWPSLIQLERNYFFWWTTAGTGKVLFSPTQHCMTQANDYVEYLPVYLAHSHSEEVYCWFTPDAISEAQAMRWDTEKQQPISKDGLNLHTSIQSLDLIWCVTPPSSTPRQQL